MLLWQECYYGMVLWYGTSYIILFCTAVVYDGYPEKGSHGFMMAYCLGCGHLKNRACDRRLPNLSTKKDSARLEGDDEEDAGEIE